jgi:hydroxypyruvate reductase
LDRALAAVNGHQSVRRALLADPIREPVRIFALGKASQAMAEGACAALGSLVRGGLVVSKPGHLDSDRLTRLGLDTAIGGHPVPTSGSLEAGQLLLDAIERTEEPVSLFLISGGASSLVEAPVSGVELPELVRMNRWLLGSGLPIDAINLVRQSVSRIKGGGLLGPLGGRGVRVLAISDVPGDDPGIIGSGLLVPASDLARRISALALPEWLMVWVRRGLSQRTGIPDAGPPVELAASLDLAKRASADAAAEIGMPVRVDQTFLEGDAAERGRELARLLIEGGPGVRVWGGEPTVHLPPTPGRGGRNQHLALAAAIGMAGHPNCYLLSAGTDGTDGPTDDAGALIDGGTLERAEAAGFDAARCLAGADAGSLLAATADLIRTGPTGTNVMDLVLGLRL